VVPLALARAHGVDRRQLGITRPPALVMIGAVVCGAGLWWLAMRVAMPVIAATDRQEEVQAWSQALFAGRPSWPFLVTTIVIVPSVCEELAHRGLLAAGLTPRFGRIAALAIATAVFAALHLEPGRIAATALLGAAASAVAAWGRSLAPAVALHAVNNLIVTILGTDAIPVVPRAIDRHPTSTTVAATALTAAGLALAYASRAAQSPPVAAGSGTVSA
jgi:membrane protease YdiL (CAAX protease family)